MFRLYRGGIHPLTHKQERGISWREKPIEIMPAPPKVYVSLSQHIGKPAQAVVKKGDKVLVGQLIACAAGFVSANIHSSVSGTVEAVVAGRNAAGAPVETIVIDNDNEYASVEFRPLDPITREGIIKAAEEMGLAGMGGAMFPTHVKLSSKDKIDTVIINGAECEPYITADDRLMREYSAQIISGALLVQKAVEAKRIIIGIEGNKPEAIRDMTAAAAQYGDITVKRLPKRYPMGSEKQLIYQLTGRIVKSGALPSSVGCVVQNVATANALCEAVYQGRPVTGRITTVAGSAIAGGRNLFIPIGTRVCDVLDYLGVDKQSVGKVISGGPMMGIAMGDITASITKGSSGLLLLDSQHASLPKETPCIRCGRCVAACPMGLMPVRIDAAQRAGLTEEFTALRAQDCIECGSCTFICPAKRYLMQSIRLAKGAALKKIREEKK